MSACALGNLHTRQYSVAQYGTVAVLITGGLAHSIVAAVVGAGLLRHRPWARITAMVLAVIRFCITALLSLGVLLVLGSMAILLTYSPFLVIELWIILYLRKPTIARLFLPVVPVKA